METTAPGNGSYLADPGNFHRLTGPADVIASAEDSVWFEQHPERTFRLRPALPGELGAGAASTTPGPAAGVLVVVHAAISGFRLRQPFTASPEAAALLLRIAPHERLCGLLWHQVAPPELVELAKRAIEVVSDANRRRSMN